MLNRCIDFYMVPLRSRYCFENKYTCKRNSLKIFTQKRCEQFGQVYKSSKMQRKTLNKCIYFLNTLSPCSRYRFENKYTCKNSLKNFTQKRCEQAGQVYKFGKMQRKTLNRCIYFLNTLPPCSRYCFENKYICSKK